MTIIVIRPFLALVAIWRNPPADILKIHSRLKRFRRNEPDDAMTTTVVLRSWPNGKVRGSNGVSPGPNVVHGAKVPC